MRSWLRPLKQTDGRADKKRKEKGVHWDQQHAPNLLIIDCRLQLLTSDEPTVDEGQDMVRRKRAT